ncbi:Zn-dependent hydrolase [Brucella pseudogrignonensis]|uniref:Zn-dependent hydrolase n=1 Tax=Brucella pseudogrignonensis TaxID=419475 RepID=UPI00190B8131|nr:Zn-dependent hydrolase [Brucella pseudogrignonensis]MBK0023050.1 Zn-dependent hydrolase [Ochrobactrum sp. S45]MBK0045066.1 Zn-dependent hydrolase [Ochrobactrum sp. S46]UKK95838.1 Zn-dependent hydrolase [Brucella pseudogrignonensis]
MVKNLPVEASRIEQDIEALARITEPDRPYTRRVFSPFYHQGRAYLEKRMREAGLETRIDVAGNLIGRRSGSGQQREQGRGQGPAVIMLGSHSDTVPAGGRFDGIAGVVAALEVARALSELGIELVHDLEVVDFLAEEVSPFGVSCIGSRGMTGQLPQQWLSRVSDGLMLKTALEDAGGDAQAVVSHRRDDLAAFLELHIEQGPVLETTQSDIGIVTAIAGISRFEIILEGRPDHAGTTPMQQRCDALVAAARLVLDINQYAIDQAAMPGHFTATVGEFSIEPNAANVVPAQARLLIDARAEYGDAMQHFALWLDAAAISVASSHDVRIAGLTRLSDNSASPSDDQVLAHLEQACQKLGASFCRLASGAGHDAAWLSKITPSAMIFVPSRGGRSHTPDEWTETSEITLGAAVLYQAVISLDEALSKPNAI